MSGGTFSSSAFNWGAWTGAGARPRATMLGVTGMNSKRRRTRRTLLGSANLLFWSALLFIVGLGIYNGSYLFSALTGDGGSQSSSATKSTNGVGILDANTDITTKGLYDEIEFKDEEGGVWRQGWNVQYDGNEWDEEQLKVIVTPHSHNDPGWIRTVEEYYQERSRNILSTIVQALNKDKRRKFIWEEMSFLERWWRDASEVEKNDFKFLVKTGQLEIVGGGWVMNDEANSHYYAIIQQMIAGNVWLQDTIGVTVKNAWAIDPFGHSPTMAYLLRRMGFKNMLIQRTHYEVKKELARKKNLEFMWRQSWDDSNTTDIFCHMMPFYSYDIPHTCGPDPSICCQFDYWRLPTANFHSSSCPWGIDPVETTPENVKERAELLLDQYRKKSTLYRSNTLLVPLGDDFRYTSIHEAELQFSNLQKIFDYINSQPYLRAKVNFGTLEDYFTTLREEVGEMTPFQPTSHSVPGFPTLSGDFFTYSDVRQDYWSGYYVSRPFFKAMDRVLEETLRAADILFSLSLAYCQAEKSEFPLSSTSMLVSARRNLALFQHHDGVTGTAKTHVMQDYGGRMHSSVQDLLLFMAKSVKALLSKRTSFGAGMCAADPDGEVNFYEPEQTREEYDLLPVKSAVVVTRYHVRRVVLFNSLEEILDQVVTIVVNEPLMCVFDSDWRPIPSQVSPQWDFVSDNQPGTGKHRLQWVAKVDPMGLQTYIVAPSSSVESCMTATTASLSVLNSPPDFICPTPYKCSLQRDQSVEIENQHQVLVFDGYTGLLQGIEIKDVGEAVIVEEELAFYSSKGSGAYLFEPDGEAKSYVHPGGLILVSKGPLMEEVYSRPNYLGPLPVVRSARLYAGTSVQAGITEMEYHTMLHQHTFNNMELIARFKTELNNNGVFYSDLNGFQTSRRETLDKIPVQGNYYPMPSLAFIQCPGGRRFSIHSRQALGVASLGKGWLEVMLDRRLTNDDGRGLGDGVLDNHQNSVVFHLLLEKNVSQTQNFEQSSASRLPSLLSHRSGAQLNYPLHAFIGRLEKRANIEESSTGNDPLHKLTFSPFTSKMPCDLHVVAMQALDGAGMTDSSKQNVGLLIQRRGFDAAYGVSMDLVGRAQCRVVEDAVFPLKSIFQDLEISDVKLTSLNLVLDDESEFESTLEQVHRKERASIKRERTPALIEIAPLEIKGYKFRLRS